VTNSSIYVFWLSELHRRSVTKLYLAETLDISQTLLLRLCSSFTQNRCQKVFNRGALRFCGGGFTFVRGGIYLCAGGLAF